MNKRNVRFVGIFPGCRNVHLIKGVGVIPYYMYKNHGMDAHIACYKNDTYEYLDTYVKGLKLDFVPKKHNRPRLDFLCYLWKMARKIDVLYLIHCSNSDNYYYILLYQWLNPAGKVYLKLDAGFSIRHEKPLGREPLSKLRMRILRRCTLISAEAENTAEALKQKWRGVNIIYADNGFMGGQKKVDYSEKKNIILAVGRLGTYQKDTECLLEGFARFAQVNKQYKLRCVGSIDASFLPFLNRFMKDHPDLQKRVSFTGEITDREQLLGEYRMAKIFCMPSRWESTGISSLEAMAAGCYLLLSDTDSAFDLTDYGEYGKIFHIEDSIGLARCMEKVCRNEKLLEKNCEAVQRFVVEKHDWEKIVEGIYAELFEKTVGYEGQR